MSSSFTAPYNVTISNDSPTITYFPYRDGPVSGGWNLTCTNSIEATWVPHSFCAGTSSHRTTYVGASLLIEFEGTAAYLYGQASAGSFVIELDGQTSYSSPGNPSLGLLSKTEGLAFGKHRLSFNVTQAATISFSEAVLTVGVGNTNSGAYNLRNRTLAPFTQTSDGLSTLNPQFNYTGAWYTNVPGTIGVTNVVYPRQHTNQAGAYVTFNLDQTSAFFIYGLINFDLGLFSVTLTPPLDLGSPVMNFYNSSARWVSLDRVMYWASGLDRDKQYSVKITNLGQGTMPWWDFSHIDIIDAGSTSGGSSPGSSPKGKHGVSTGIIGGAAAGAIVLLLLLLVGFLYFRKRRRSKPATTKMEESQRPFDYSIPPAAQNVPYNPYASTPYELMPVLPGSPGVYNPLQQPLVDTGHPGVQPTQFKNATSPPPPLSSFPSLLPSPPPPSSSELSSSRQLYQSGGLVALSGNESEPSSGSRGGVAQQSGGPRFVQEEDAGTLSPPEENVVRLPPDYKDVWSQGYR